jgi:hypothetical protein
MALEARSPAVALEARSPAVALEARSPAVAMATTPLSQAQTARLLAAECYRHKRDYMVLYDHFRILSQLRKAEARLCSRSPLGIWELLRFENGRFLELQRLIWETIDRRDTIELQMLDLGGEKCGALSQASLSVLGTVTIGERRCITQAVEPQDFKDGAVLIKEGEPRDALFIVVEGQVSFTQRPGPDEPEPVVKSDSLLTNQPCECTLTAVGPVKVLVLHGAREWLADYRAEEAAREVREPSTAPLPPEVDAYFDYVDRGETHEWQQCEIQKITARWTSEHEIRMPDAAFAKVQVQDDAQTGWEQSVDPACDARPDPATMQLRKRRPLT